MPVLHEILVLNKKHSLNAWTPTLDIIVGLHWQRYVGAFVGLLFLNTMVWSSWFSKSSQPGNWRVGLMLYSLIFSAFICFIAKQDKLHFCFNFKVAATQKTTFKL